MAKTKIETEEHHTYTISACGIVAEVGKFIEEKTSITKSVIKHPVFTLKTKQKSFKIICDTNIPKEAIVGKEMKVLLTASTIRTKGGLKTNYFLSK
jgi:hypothetical protein